MKNLKKILAFTLTLVMIMQSTILAADVKKPLAIKGFSEAFPEAYLEEEFVDFSNIELKLEENILKVNSKNERILQKIEKLNKEEDTIKKIEERIKEGATLLGIGTITAYAENTYEKIDNEYVIVDSRLLSEEELMENTNIFNSVNTLTFNPKTNTRGSLTIRIMVWDEAPSTGAEYTVSGNAFWTDYSTFGSEKAAEGNDFLGIYWGGGFDYSDYGCVVMSSDPDYDIPSYLADQAPNGGFVYEFPELVSVLNSIYAEQITVGTLISKNTLTGSGNTTSVVVKYIHTYEEVEGSINVGVTTGSTGGISGGITLSGVSKQWPLTVSINGLEY